MLFALIDFLLQRYKLYAIPDGKFARCLQQATPHISSEPFNKITMASEGNAIAPLVRFFW